VISEKLMKSAPVVAILILIAVAVSIFLLDKPDSIPATQATPQVTTTQVTTTDEVTSARSVVSSAPANVVSGQSATAQSTTAMVDEKDDVNSSVTAAPMLSNLLAGLEKKVADDPTNIGSKMLLAQTYAEVGEVSRGLVILREMLTKEPDNQKMRMVYATVLGKSDNPAELNEALKLLNTLDQSEDPAQKGSVLLQKGRVYLRMGEPESAKKEWTQALVHLPEGNGYRKQVELELSRLN